MPPFASATQRADDELSPAVGLENNNISLLDAAKDIPLVLPKGDYMSVMLASLAANVLALALPVMTLQVYDRILVNGGISTLAVLSGAVLVAVIAEWFLRVSRSYIMGMAGTRFELNTSEEAVRRILAADLRKSERHNAGEYLEGLSAIGRMRDFYAGNLVTSFVDMPFMAIYLALIAYLAHSLVWVPTVLLVLFGMIVWMMGRHMRSLVRRREESDSHRYSRVIEMLSGLHSVKGLGLEAKMQRLYERLLAEGSEPDYALSMTNGLAYMLGGLMSQIMMVAVVVAGAPLVIEGGLSMGALIACLLLSGRLTQPLMRALSLWANFQEVRLAREQVATLYALPKRENGSSDSALNFGDDAVPVTGEVAMRDVSFHYHEAARWVVHDVSLEIPAGQAVALMGTDAIAKSALLELMVGLYAPTRGQVWVDGMPVADLPDEIRSRHVAYVPADAEIFRGTIMENLCQFQPQYEAAARELSEWMGIAEDVSKLPMGYETPLSPAGQGDEISPGLRQRVAIVRALVTHPRLLLLDNADRALDRRGYNCLFRLLGQIKGKATIVLVSEDQNLLRLTDRRLVIHQGALLGTVPEMGQKRTK